MTFGSKASSLVVQGLTIEPLLKWLKLGRNNSEQIHQYETLRGRLLTLRTAQQRLQEMSKRGLISDETTHVLSDEYAQREKTVRLELQQLHLANDFLQEEQLRTARRRLLQLEKSTINDLFGQGLISEEALQELKAEINSKATLLDLPLKESENANPTLLAARIAQEDEIIEEAANLEMQRTSESKDAP